MVNYYRYEPSLPVNIILMIIFWGTSAVHLYQIVRTKTWFFIPFLIGSVCMCRWTRCNQLLMSVYLVEAIGFIGRVMGAEQAPSYTFPPFVMQSLLLLLGPTCYAAAIYMILGRLVVLLGAEHHSLIRPNWLTKSFLFGDVVSIALQGIGGGKLANADTNAQRSDGETLIIAGLIVQLVFFGLFMITTGIFHQRITRSPTETMSTLTVRWQRFLMAVYATTVLILIRSIFRLVEYIMGHDSELQSKEVYIFVLDTALMAVASILMNFFHPSKYLVAAPKRSADLEFEMRATPETR